MHFLYIFSTCSFTNLLGNDVCFLCAHCSYAEQLVLYMKAEEFLSSALHTAKETIKKGQLHPSATVKQGETSHCLLNVCSLLSFWRNKRFGVLQSAKRSH